MVVLFAVFLLICFYKARINFCSYADPEYLSIDRTKSIKGVFIIIVFFSHFNSYATFTNYYDLQYLEFIQFIGQSMVTLFLFYSGYGVMESIKRKGLCYVNRIPVKRMLGVLIRLDIAVMLYVALDLILGIGNITIGKVLLSLFGWESVGNSNWYIFVIILMYAITYVSFEFFGRCSRFYSFSVAVVTVLTTVYVVVILKLDLRPSHWANTALCYPIGMIWSLTRGKIDKFLNRNIVNYIISLLACLTVSTVFRAINGISLIYHVFFALFIVLLTMHLTLDNRILRWCGQHLFEIYILQRIPMIICSRVGLFVVSNVLSFAVCLLSTVAFSFVYAKALNFLLKRLKIS